MYKPASLRAVLTTAVPDLGHDHERLRISIPQGSVRCRPAGLSWEYSYELEVVVLDYQYHPDLLIVTILEWLKQHQPDMFQNWDSMQNGYTFEVDYLSHNVLDMSIKLRLTENVQVRHDADGVRSITHLQEPAAEFEEPLGEMRFYVNGDLVGSYRKTSPYAPATTIPADEL